MAWRLLSSLWIPSHVPSLASRCMAAAREPAPLMMKNRSSTIWFTSTASSYNFFCISPIDGSEVSDDLISSSDPAPIEVDDAHDQVPIGIGGTHAAAPMLAGNMPMVYQAFRAKFLRFIDGLFGYLLLLIAFFSTLIQGLAQRVAGVRLQARAVAVQAAFSRFFPCHCAYGYWNWTCRA
ncbi:hypothetical protein BC940DRAFT_321301 [Gongronella butleri]|nr:hypothetical protein BC940DRAFT_321301 [Gongronella butleri]